MNWEDFGVYMGVLIREVLFKADTRAAEGDGITITTVGNSVATISVDLDEADIPAEIARASDVTTDIAAAVTDHEAAANPHPTYLTQAEGDALYEPTASILAVTTVGALPAASGSNQGVRSFVTDANSTTFLATAAGGGANKVPVISNGVNWIIG